jgi:aminoglycoside phosphotransferase (APT) family kinase protein
MAVARHGAAVVEGHPAAGALASGQNVPAIHDEYNAGLRTYVAQNTTHPCSHIAQGQRSRMTLHEGEFPIDDATVRRLLSDQMPAFADLPLHPIEASGTVNRIYRLGDDMVVRLPRTSAFGGGPAREARWMPVFRPLLPLEVPRYVALGRPSERYPSPWSVISWIEGDVAEPSALADLDGVADVLGRFVVALRDIPSDGAPPGGSYRGLGLAKVDADMRAWAGKLPDDLDRSAVLRTWEDCLAYGEWTGRPTWFHSDLRSANLIASHGDLVGVIDWESCSVGDPSSDLLPAWWLFDGGSRETFRVATGAGKDEWHRAKGWALFMAVAAIPYYRTTNPVFVAHARKALAEILADA